MEFYDVLQMATQKQGQNSVQKRYSLAVGPPKKDPKVKGVQSAAVQAFLRRKEDEIRKKELVEKRKKEKLLEKRKELNHDRKAKAMASRTKDNFQGYNGIPIEEKPKKRRSRKEREQEASQGTEEEEYLTEEELYEYSQTDSDIQELSGYEEEPPQVTPKPKAEKKAPSAMTFMDLLRLAEKKQFEPVEIKVVKKVEERPLTAEQLREKEFLERKNKKIILERDKGKIEKNFRAASPAVSSKQTFSQKDSHNIKLSKNSVDKHSLSKSNLTGTEKKLKSGSNEKHSYLNSSESGGNKSDNRFEKCGALSKTSASKASENGSLKLSQKREHSQISPPLSTKLEVARSRPEMKASSSSGQPGKSSSTGPGRPNSSSGRDRPSLLSVPEKSSQGNVSRKPGGGSCFIPGKDRPHSHPVSGKDRPGSSLGSVSGKNRPGGNLGSVSAKDRPGDSLGSVFGKDRPGGNLGAVSGKDRPGGSLGSVPGKNRPGGSLGSVPGKDRPGGSLGSVPGKDRPGGSLGSVPGKDRPGGSLGSVPGKDRPGGSLGSVPGKDRPRSSLGSVPGKDRPRSSLGSVPGKDRPAGSLGSVPGKDRPGGSLGSVPGKDRPGGSSGSVLGRPVTMPGRSIVNTGIRPGLSTMPKPKCTVVSETISSKNLVTRPNNGQLNDRRPAPHLGHRPIMHPPGHPLPPITSAYKRKIEDEDDEWDSEMDDFIDDSGESQDEISKHIREIFGYDKNKYKDESDYALRYMETSWKDQQKEESRSLRLGMEEDLEEMRREEEELKSKKQVKKLKSR